MSRTLDNKKSSLACRWSVERLASTGNGWVYLWTFTTPDVVEADEIGRRWAALWDILRKVFPKLALVRVFEPHTKGHGWHVHAVTVTRLDVNRIRPLAEGCRFGRINAKRIPSSEAGYVAKYLTKAKRRSKGTRLWAAAGKGSASWASRIKDIEFTSLEHTYRKRITREWDYWRRMMSSLDFEQAVQRVLWMLAEDGFMDPFWRGIEDEVPIAEYSAFFHGNWSDLRRWRDARPKGELAVPKELRWMKRN